MKTRSMTYSVLVAMTAGAIGYFIRGQPRDPAMLLPSEVPFLHVYVAKQSFSEIRNARAALDELRARYVMTVQIRRHVNVRGSAGRNTVPDSHVEPHLAGAIEELEQGMQEFRGTGQEFIVARELLKVLKKSRRYDRWLEVYLDILYQHPTQPLIGSLASDAIVAAKAAGSEDVLVAGFKHLTAIPLEFDAKEQVQEALISLQHQDPDSAETGSREHELSARD